ncbi:hypothetical protein JW877_03640 [bacterium]|nr:hypothetical protein [bacterium]
MKRTLFFILVLLLLSAIACIRVEKKMVINKDGSGIMELHYAMDTATVNLIRSASEWSAAGDHPIEAPLENEGDEDSLLAVDDDQDKDWILFTEEEVKQMWTSDIMTLKSYRNYAEEGLEHVELVIEIEDMVQFIRNDEMNEGSMIFRNDAGNYVITTEAMFEEEDLDDGESEEQQLIEMRSTLEGFYMTVEIVVPTSILETNAHSQKGKSAKWVYDLEEDDSFLKMDRGLYLEFKGKGLDF